MVPSGFVRVKGGAVQTDYLKYLIDIAETKSIAAAAKRSFISPQGARKAIAALEQDLGCKLIKREGRATELTEFGEVILDDARGILGLEAKMHGSIDRLLNKQTTSPAIDVVIYQAGAFDTFTFQPLSNGFARELQGAHFINCDNESVIQNLTAPDSSEAAVRLGILTLFSPLVEENASMLSRLTMHGYSVFPWLETYDELAVSERSALAKAESVTFEDIRRHWIIFSNVDIMAVARKVLGPDVNGMLITDSGYEYRMVAKDEAVCFAPALDRIYQGREGIAHVPIQDTYKVTMCFVAKPDAESLRHMRRLRSYLNDFYDGIPESDRRYFTILT